MECQESTTWVQGQNLALSRRGNAETGYGSRGFKMVEVGLVAVLNDDGAACAVEELRVEGHVSLEGSTP